MLPKSNKEIAAEIKALFIRWRRILGLQSWRIFLAIRETTPAGEEPERASCEALSEYSEATIVYTLDRLNGTNLNELTAHEMVHCLTHPLESVADEYAKKHPDAAEWARRETERTVTSIADVLVALVKQYDDLMDKYTALKAKEK